MNRNYYSLEQKMVEPFRSIRWLSISRQTILLSLIGLLVFGILWWTNRGLVFNFWANELRYLISFVDEPWNVQFGSWPDTLNTLFVLPKLNAAITPPTRIQWWLFTAGTLFLWTWSGLWRASFLPLRTLLRFIIFLVWITLTCFVISPFYFQHSVEEWSKIYFLASYGSIFIYAGIWLFGVIWFPIPQTTKIFLTLIFLIFELLSTPILLFNSALLLRSCSLVILPLFAAFVPLIQLGWFIGFYSFALSSGNKTNDEGMAI